jgi:hypothetical protein
LITPVWRLASCRISQRGLQQEMGGGGGAAALAALAAAAPGHNGIAAGPQQPIFGNQFAPQVSPPAPLCWQSVTGAAVIGGQQLEHIVSSLKHALHDS